MPPKNLELDRVPPCDTMAEQAVLGAMLMPDENHISIPQAIEILGVDGLAFYKTAHQRIYQAMVSIFQRSEGVDLVTVTKELKSRGELDAVGGVAAIDLIWESCPDASHVDHYANLVVEAYKLRILIRYSFETFHAAFDPQAKPIDIVNIAQRGILDILDGCERHKVQTAKQVLSGVIRKLNEMSERGEDIIGLKTGFRDLDRITLGLQKSEMIVVAGRPSMGKSMLVQNIAQNVARQGKKVAFFTVETSSDNLIMRMIAMEGNFPFYRLRQAKLYEEEWSIMMRVAGSISEMKLFLDDTAGITASELTAKAHRLHIQYGLDLVIVDYLQLMQPDGKQQTREQEVAQISTALKRLAKDLAVPVIAVSQLSRSPEHREDKRPRLADLRESGTIEQDADVVLLMFRESYYDHEIIDDTTEVIVAKQRNGATDVVHLFTDAEKMKFGNLSSDKDVPTGNEYD